MFRYAALCQMTGNKITAEGIIAAGASGFITGAESILATPIARTFTQTVGASATGILTKGTSSVIQTVADILAYRVESLIKNEPFSYEVSGTREVISVGVNIVAGGLFGGTKGMSIMNQVQYFAPDTTDAFIDASLHPEYLGAYNVGIIIKTSLIQEYGVLSFIPCADIGLAYHDSDNLLCEDC